MPIYEYQCSDCAHRFEQIQKLSDPILTVCPICSKDALKKLISAAGFQLKGSGWYVTDFKNSSPNRLVSTPAESAPTVDKTPTLT